MTSQRPEATVSDLATLSTPYVWTASSQKHTASHWQGIGNVLCWPDSEAQQRKELKKRWLSAEWQ
jgi:hypothetical protein